MSNLPIGGPTPAQLRREAEKPVQPPPLTEEQLQQAWEYIIARAGKSLLRPIYEAGVRDQMAGRAVGLNKEGYVDNSLLYPLTPDDFPPITVGNLPPEVILEGEDAVLGRGLFEDGTAAEPSVSYINDPDTGMWRQTDNVLGWSTNGVNRMGLSNSAFQTVLPLRVADGTEAAPAIQFAADTNVGIYRTLGDQMHFSAAGTYSMSINNLGVTIPTGYLKVSNGNIRASQNVAAGAKVSLGALNTFVIVTSVAGSSVNGGLFYCAGTTVTRTIGSANITTDGTGTLASVWHDGTEFVYQNKSASTHTVGIWNFNRL